MLQTMSLREYTLQTTRDISQQRKEEAVKYDIKR